MIEQLSIVVKIHALQIHLLQTYWLQLATQPLTRSDHATFSSYIDTHPVLRSPAAMPLIDRWMPRCMRSTSALTGSVAPLRLR